MSRMRLSVPGSMQSMSRKCRGAMAARSLIAEARSRSWLGDAFQRLRQPLHRFRDLLLGDVERGKQAHDVLAGTDRQELLLHTRRYHIAHRRLDLDADQQPAAAHLLDHIRVFVLDAGERLLEP